MFLITHGTEWPILCWCAVKQLLTHSSRHIFRITFNQSIRTYLYSATYIYIVSELEVPQQILFRLYRYITGSLFICRCQSLLFVSFMCRGTRNSFWMKTNEIAKFSILDEKPNTILDEIWTKNANCSLKKLSTQILSHSLPLP